jgi:hypothetical protein
MARFTATSQPGRGHDPLNFPGGARVEPLHYRMHASRICMLEKMIHRCTQLPLRLEYRCAVTKLLSPGMQKGIIRRIP